MSEVRTVYSKKAYCGRRSILLTGTLYPMDCTFFTTFEARSSFDVPDDHIIVTCSWCGCKKKAVPVALALLFSPTAGAAALPL